ncbi:MFS transporter [Bacillus sp. 03113]|uniref:MFS transporter n=1 Tax=Bacillus sp. 03113 TaxID=2578211 RepID=UPI0011443722|nr:MFS transporter [Bacillus sp. 03113]
MKGLRKNRAFFYMWTGSMVSELGGAFGTFCNSIIIYELTGSKTALGSMWLLYFIPSLILQLFIGPFIDKWSRKWMMIFSQWTRGLVFLIPLVIMTLGEIEPWHIYVVQIVVGLITPIYVPAAQAITPTIVSKSQLKAANAYLDGMVRLMTFLAPVLGGVVIEYTGTKLTLFLVCIFLFASSSLLMLVKETRTSKTVRQTWAAQFRAGISFYFQQPVLIWLAIFLAFVQFGVGVSMVINLPYITDELKASYAEYGYFMASFPLGYVIGSFFVGKKHVDGRRFIMLGALIIGGATYISLAFNQNIILAYTTEMIAGISLAFFNAYNTTIFQETVPNDRMGNVFSIRLFIIRGMMPLGVLAGGVLSELWGIRSMYFLIGSIICVASFIGLVLPYFRFLDLPQRE